MSGVRADDYDDKRQGILDAAAVLFAQAGYANVKMADIARVLNGAKGTTMLLAHDPRRLREAAALNVPLLLSGHTHGGQIVLPGVGAIAASGFPLVAGATRQENTTAFVSRGVGTVYLPVRLNCPPEVNVLTLTPVL